MKYVMRLLEWMQRVRHMCDVTEETQGERDAGETVGETHGVDMLQRWGMQVSDN